MDLTKEAIEKLVSLGRPETVEVNGLLYATGSISLVKEPKPDVLEVHTLTALLDYMSVEANNLNVGAFIRVVNHERVDVVSRLLEPFNQRHTYISAVLIAEPFRFNQFMDIESVIIGLLSRFQDTPDREGILQKLSGMTVGTEVTYSDDGITQNVTMARGTSMKQIVNLQRIVKLRPFRTFAEIEQQPESDFVWRVRGGDERTAPTAALFEADGGRWRLDAIAEIRKWLESKLENVTILA